VSKILLDYKHSTTSAPKMRLFNPCPPFYQHLHRPSA
jgi:hypothetical protein